MLSKMVSFQSKVHGRRKRQNCTCNSVSLSCYSSVLDDGLNQVLQETTLSFPSQPVVYKWADSLFCVFHLPCLLTFQIQLLPDSCTC